MHLADLFFILVFLATVVALLRVLYLALRGRRSQSGRVLRRTLLAVGVYLAVVVLVSLVSPRRWVAVGEEQRFDDWAITIERAERSDSGYVLAVRVANHGRGRPQAERGVDLVLVGDDGREYPSAAAPGQPSLRAVLQPGESLVATRVFAVPPGLPVRGIRIIHGAWPGWFIIGDDQSLLHKRPLVRLGA